MYNSAIFFIFYNPGIKASPIPGFGIEKMGRDSGERSDWNPYASLFADPESHTVGIHMSSNSKCASSVGLQVLIILGID